MPPKFRIYVFAEPCNDGETFRMRVENRAGRAWISKSQEMEPGNLAESAMVLEEMICGGRKLNPDCWMSEEEYEKRFPV